MTTMMHNDVGALFSNASFVAVFFGWTIAQLTKMLCNFIRTHRIDFAYLVSTGGMPSAHSSMVSALATSVGLRSGFGAPVSVVALCFASIVMFDASTVRRATGLQARLLNDIIDELFSKHRFSESKLKELIGHTRFEVVLGMIMGIFIGILVTSQWALNGWD